MSATWLPALLTAALFGACAASLTALSWPWLRRLLSRCDPARRARLLSAVAAAPAAVGVLGTALCFVPCLLERTPEACRHCADHAGLLHLCGVPYTPAATSGWWVVALILLPVLVPLVGQLGRLLRSGRLVRRLEASTVLTADGEAWVVETDRVFAATTPRGRILVSRRLLDGLSSAELAAVLAHERAHVERGDLRRRVLASLLACAHLPHVRRALLDDLHLASEQACDEVAGAAVGDRLDVVRALLAIGRLDARALGPAALAFSEGHLVARVEALLAPPRAPVSAHADGGLLLLVGLASVAAAHPIHHLAEALVGLLT